VLAWLSVCSEVQMICIWFSKLYGTPIVNLNLSKSNRPVASVYTLQYSRSCQNHQCSNSDIYIAHEACAVYENLPCSAVHTAGVTIYGRCHIKRSYSLHLCHNSHMAIHASEKSQTQTLVYNTAINA